MTRRIDIELTSDRGDGTWTWRAAGAKQPKGTLEASTLFDGANVGDVCRADADFAMDGIFIEAVLPPKGRSGRAAEEQITLTGGSFEGGVTTTWKERKGGDRDRKRGRDGDRGRGRGRGEGGGGRSQRGSEDKRTDGENRGGQRRSQGGGGDERGPRRDGRNRGGDGERGRNQRGPREDTRPKPKKLRPGRAHRNAWIETLPEEQKIIAETLSRGGIQAVRKEIDAQNEKAKADGSQAIDGTPLLALAEGMLTNLRRCEWRDRAEAALTDMGEIDLKDLRSVVVAAEDSAKDDESRELADKLRTGLAERVEAAQTEWVSEIASTLADGRVVRALRLSSRPPKAGALLPGDLLQRLTDAANEAVTGEVTQQRLATVVDAVSRSVARPNFVLETIPAEPTDELLEAVKKVAPQLPEVAAKFGVSAKRRPRRGAKKAAPKRPPKPTTPPAASSPDGAAAATDDAPAAPEAPDTESPAPDVSPADSPAADSTETPSADPAGSESDSAHADETPAPPEPEPAPADGDVAEAASAPAEPAPAPADDDATEPTAEPTAEDSAPSTEADSTEAEAEVAAITNDDSVVEDAAPEAEAAAPTAPDAEETQPES